MVQLVAIRKLQAFDRKVRKHLLLLSERKKQREREGFIRSVVISGHQFLSEQKTPGTHLHPLAALMFPSADHGLFLSFFLLVTLMLDLPVCIWYCSFPQTLRPVHQKPLAPLRKCILNLHNFHRVHSYISSLNYHHFSVLKPKISQKFIAGLTATIISSLCPIIHVAVRPAHCETETRL